MLRYGFISIVILTIAIISKVFAAYECESGFEVHQSYCWKLNSSIKLGFTSANSACKEMQSNLASIHSQSEQDFAMQLLRNGPNITQAWIGLKDPNNTEQFLNWEDKTPVDYKAQIQFNTSSEKRITLLESGIWKDDYGSSEHYYLCKKSATLTPNTTEVPTTADYTVADSSVITGTFKLVSQTDQALDKSQHLIHTVTSFSAIDCALKCLRVNNCKGINHEKVGIWCDLLEANAQEFPSDLQATNGFLHYKKNNILTEPN